MRCNLCGRPNKPEDRGWVSLMTHHDGSKKPLVFTYCPECLDHALTATPFERRKPEDP